jgi:3',5'-cyclic AMP phosphodiesterase CpdA
MTWARSAVLAAGGSGEAHSGDFLNLGVSVCILIGTLILLGVFRASVHAQGRPLTGVVATWALVWACWVVFYSLKLHFNWERRATRDERLILSSISDLNSVLLLVMYWVLTRWAPRTLRALAIVIVLFLLEVGPVAIGLFITGGVLSTWTRPDVFLRGVSLTAAIIAPMMLGHGFRCRYGSKGIIFFTVAYAVMQPFGYVAAFDDHIVSVVYCDPKGDLPLTLVAFVKSLPPSDQGPKYIIRGRADNGARPSVAQLKELERWCLGEDPALKPHLLFWLRLRFGDIVSSLLALLKVLLAFAVATQLHGRIRIVGPSFHPPPDSGVPLAVIPQESTSRVLHWGLGILVLVTTQAIYGWFVVFAVVIAATTLPLLAFLVMKLWTALIPKTEPPPRAVVEPVRPAVPTLQREFAWIHLSDLHFVPPKPADAQNQKLILHALLQDVSHMMTDGPWVPSAIIVTGDIAYKGLKEEYNQAAIWLDAVIGATDLERDRVYVIPGNHDVNRRVDVEDPDIGRLVTLVRNANMTLDEALAGGKDRQRLRARQAAFERFAREYAAPTLDATMGDAPAVVWDIPTSAGGVSIIGLNSALLAADDQDQGRLFLGNGQLAKGLARNSTTKLKIALTHHPAAGGWLADSGEFTQHATGKVHVHLCGHVHDHVSETRRGGHGSQLITVTAGAAHAPNEPPHRRHGYTYAEVLKLESGRRELRVWPRVMEPGDPHFRLDARSANKNRLFAVHPLPDP